MAFFNDIDCRKCNKQIQKIRGCNEEIAPVYLEGIEVRRCVLKIIPDSTMAYMQAYFEYKNGFLPNTGGWLEQPMKFTHSIVLIDKLVTRYQEKQYGGPKP